MDVKFLRIKKKSVRVYYVFMLFISFLFLGLVVSHKLNFIVGMLMSWVLLLTIFQIKRIKKNEFDEIKVINDKIIFIYKNNCQNKELLKSNLEVSFNKNSIVFYPISDKRDYYIINEREWGRYGQLREAVKGLNIKFHERKAGFIETILNLFLGSN